MKIGEFISKLSNEQLDDLIDMIRAEKRERKREHYKNYNKMYREKNKEYFQKYQKEWASKNKEKIKKRKREYYQANKEKYREIYEKKKLLVQEVN